jgi:arylsulfatase A-like enzyme
LTIAKTSARSGAIQGLMIWTVYWLIESFLLHIRPWLTGASEEYMPSHAGFTAIMLGIYALTGLLTGAAAGMLIHNHKVTPLAITLFLCVLTLVTVLVSLPRELPLWVQVLVFLPLGISFLISLGSPAWRERLTFLTNPWTAIMFLLAPPFVFDGTSGRLSLARGCFSILLFIGAGILLSFLVPVASRRARTILPVAAVVLLAACFPLHRTPRLSTPQHSASLPASAPNVILITLDTVRADHLSLFGYERETSPNLQRLGREAAVYSNAISTGNMTLSSHASMFTGLYPSWHRAIYENEHGRFLDEKVPTLAEILSDKGYESVSIVSNFSFLAHTFGLDRGFSYQDSAPPVQMLGGRRAFLLRDQPRRWLGRLIDPWKYQRVSRAAEDITDAGLAAISRETSQGKKFFLFLNYMDAHWPYLPPGRFATLYPGRDRHFRYTQAQKEVLSEQRPLSGQERQTLISQYDGAIAYMDWSLGELFDQLKERGLYDNSLLIVTSDHGEAFGDKALLGHALAVYQDEIRVPLLIKYPHAVSGQIVNEPVSLVDLLPTVLDALGYEPPPGIQGKSLLRRASGDPRYLVSEGFPSSASTKWSPRFQGTQRAIFSGSMKFLESSQGVKELYDISVDPNELHNLLPAEPGGVLEGKLSEYLRAAALHNKQDSRRVENLKSLGYLQ